MCSSYHDVDAFLQKNALSRFCDIRLYYRTAPKKCDLLRHKQTKKHESNVATAKESTMRRHLERNNLGFPHAFSINVSCILSNILHRIFPVCMYVGQTFGLK